MESLRRLIIEMVKGVVGGVNKKDLAVRARSCGMTRYRAKRLRLKPVL